ncbi:hypothetical protein ACR0ST_07675 [Aliidiomarina sp. Khilg15.8]
MKSVKTLAAIPCILFATSAFSANPYLQPDDTWIQISGTVTGVSADRFVLDYGDGTVYVEMDDGDRDADAYKLVEGDKVTVSGLVDDDMFETTTIEAGSVYVENIGTYFYASTLDEDERYYAPVHVSVDTTNTIVHGTVSSVDPAEEEFELNTGLRMITVEVDEMDYNPLDDEGYQQITAGDIVTVSGLPDYDLFEGRVFEAKQVTTVFKKP